MPPRDYQPSKNEYEEVVDMPGSSMEEVSKAFFQPIKVKVAEKPTKQVR